MSHFSLANFKIFFVFQHFYEDASVCGTLCIYSTWNWWVSWIYRLIFSIDLGTFQPLFLWIFLLLPGVTSLLLVPPLCICWCVMFIWQFCKAPLIFFSLVCIHVYPSSFKFTNSSFCQLKFTVEPFQWTFHCACYIVFHSRISICFFFFIISISLLKFSTWWDIVIVPPFTSLSIVSFSSLDI